MAAAVMWVFAAMPRRELARLGSAAANVCVSALAALTVGLALVVVVDQPEAFALAHEALARDARPLVVAGVADDEREALTAQRADARRAGKGPARSRATNGNGCAPVDAAPAHVPAGLPRDPGDYPSVPIAAVAAMFVAA